MSSIIGNYKEYIIIERESLKELETKVSDMMFEAQSDHNVEQIRKAKVWNEAIEWMKENNIYAKDFEFKQ